MNDVDMRLAELFDEIAASIDPKPDFGSVITASAATVGHGSPTPPPRAIRRGLAAVAAAVVLVGGAAAAFQLDDEPTMVATDDVSPTATTERDARTPVVGEPGGEVIASAGDADAGQVAIDGQPATIVRSAELGAGRLDTEPIRQILFGRAAPSEQVAVVTGYGSVEVVAGSDGRWKAVLELTDVPPATLVPIQVRFGDGSTAELTIVTPVAAPATTASPATLPTTTAPAPETSAPKDETPAPPPTAPKVEPKPEPKEQPTPVAFTATLGAGYLDSSPMKQVVHGTATAGTKVLVTSAYGHVTAVAGEGGAWEVHLKMYDVPAGTNVRITATATGFPETYEFWVARPAPVVKAFTAAIAATYLDGDPIKVVFQGQGTPGSVVTAASQYGSAETTIGAGGSWELKLKMAGVPAGATVGMRITDGSSGTVKEFNVTKPAAPAPEYHFKANAAFTDCDDDPPYNEYWGLAAPGSTVTISSPYGGTQVVADGAGNWSARVEFPSAPVGEKFQVVLSNSANPHTFSFGFQRLPPP